MTDTILTNTAERWANANERYLAVECARLRLLLQRRSCWLRHQWQRDPLARYQPALITDEQADWLLAREDRATEAAFYRDDSTAASITQALFAAEQEAGCQAEELAEQGTPAALDVAVHLFGLSPFEREVLLLCLAPELDPSFLQLYAYVQDDATRTYPTLQLAEMLFPDQSDRPARAALLPDRPLRGFRLVRWGTASRGDAARSVCPLVLEECVLGFLLRGHAYPDEQVAAALDPLPPSLPVPMHEELAEGLVRALETERGRGRSPLVNLTGPPEVGKRAFARAVCQRLGLQVRGLNVARLPVLEGEEVLRLLERDAILCQSAYYVEIPEQGAAEGDARRARDLVERLGVFTIVSSRERWPATRALLAVAVPKPDAATRQALWEQALPEVARTAGSKFALLVQQFDFGPDTIAEVAEAARAHARMRDRHGEGEPAAGDLWEACRAQVGQSLEALAQRLLPCYSWEDMVLPTEVLRQLQEIAAQVAQRPTVYETWGFGRKLSRGRGISVLFSGASGTGKTMAAEVLAHLLSLDLYRIDLAGVVSKYIGETEKNLRKVFDAAEGSGAILFFDEADALFGKRTEVKDSHDRYANIEVNYLLQRMEDYRGLAILATNRKSSLDQAFLRRLRFLVDFPFPDAESRARIWKKTLPLQAAVGTLDYAGLARLAISGGSIRNIVVNAAFRAAHEGTSIEMVHLIGAACREYAKIEKLVTEAEFDSYWEWVRP